MRSTAACVLGANSIQLLFMENCMIGTRLISEPKVGIIGGIIEGHINEEISGHLRGKKKSAALNDFGEAAGDIFYILDA